MPEGNSRSRRNLILDALVVVGLIVLFVVLNRSHGPQSPSETPSTTTTPGIQATLSPTPGKPTAIVTPVRIPQTPTAAPAPRKTPLVVNESKAGDEFDPKRVLSKTVKVTSHSIEMGENYWTIAKANNIDINTLLGANPTMPFKARIHQNLLILSRRGVLYRAQAGDDPAKIAQVFGVEEKLVKDENGIKWWWDRIHEGDVVFIPGVKPLLMVKEWKDYFAKRGIFGDPLGRWAKINSPFAVRTDPITGELRHHNGVDLKAKYGDPVYSAAGGRVTFTGVSGGYGNLIIIASAGGYNTYYGHLSKIYAKQGQKVRRGVLIGRVGATGRVTGPHLHFEIRKNGKAVDPLLFI